MSEIIIRKMNEGDLPRVMEIFAYARQFMKNTGNPNQWGDDWPSRQASEEDIKNGTGFVMEEAGQVFATFAFIMGEDPTYLEIDDFSQWPKIYEKMRRWEAADYCEGFGKENTSNACGNSDGDSFGEGLGDEHRVFGRWLNSEPYGTIHRLAGDGTHKNVFEMCLDFCEKQVGNVRADTYEDNRILQHKLRKNGFEACGVIYVRNHMPRIAYHKVGK